MELNTVCTIGDVIRARRDLYLSGKTDALLSSINDWFIYTKGTRDEYLLDTPCIIADLFPVLNFGEPGGRLPPLQDSAGRRTGEMARSGDRTPQGRFLLQPPG